MTGALLVCAALVFAGVGIAAIAAVIVQATRPMWDCSWDGDDE